MLHTKTTDAGAAPTQSSDAAQPGRVALLAAGDVLTFLLFAALGRSQHQEAQTLGAVANTAAPFILGWLAVAPWLGAFGRAGRAATTRPTSLLRRTALAWLIAWPVGLALRALLWHRDVPPTFALITLAFNMLVLLGWRGAVAALLWRR